MAEIALPSVLRGPVERVQGLRILRRLACAARREGGQPFDVIREFRSFSSFVIFLNPLEILAEFNLEQGPDGIKALPLRPHGDGEMEFLLILGLGGAIEQHGCKERIENIRLVTQDRWRVHGMVQADFQSLAHVLSQGG